eukprot:TRINITY_DN9597_c0_g1_i1.p1 TRINITY_DN9597_c0_g1~~TRINITY_DN9597_c0_g1_i1.p1  ORF type:complete len:174 (-),score=37.39 TRINITY_DN9597_c0_g1_i1:118-639(-)
MRGGWRVPKDVSRIVAEKLDFVSFVRFARTDKRNLELLEDASLWSLFYYITFNMPPPQLLYGKSVRAYFKENYLRTFLPSIIAKRELKKRAKVVQTMKLFHWPFHITLCNKLLEGLSLCCFFLFFILLPLVLNSTIPLTLADLSLLLLVLPIHLLLIFIISSIASLIFHHNIQ